MPVERSDLNLFRLFQTIQRHGSLTAAGRDLGVTPSAVSHALNRLRMLVGDQLFLPSGRKMLPTQRALELAPQIDAALLSLDETLAERPFRSDSTERVFRIGMSGFTGLVILPALLTRMLRAAPRVRLRVVPIGRVDLVQQLDEGRLDMVVSWFEKTPKRIRRQALFPDREALVVRQGHPLDGKKPTKAALLSFPHAMLEYTGTDDETTEGVYNERGLYRRTRIAGLLLEQVRREKAESITVVTVPEVMLIPPLLKATNLIATLPERFARECVEGGELSILQLPYKPLEVTIEVAWHERNDRDPGVKWLAEQVIAVAPTFDKVADDAGSPLAGQPEPP